jgi:hypothetical protein
MIGAKTIITAEKFTIKFAFETNIIVTIFLVLKVGKAVAEGKLIIGLL